MNKGYKNENILSIFFVYLDNWIYTSTVPILGITK